LLLCSLGTGLAAANEPVPDATLLRLRAERRQDLRDRSRDAADKGRAPTFGLLVIPVDFSDSRFPDDFAGEDLGRRVAGPDPQSLRAYFQAASGGRLELVSLVSPVVHLDGERADYSDLGWNGFNRTRAMARQALETVAAWGIDFARLDADGPDGVPGSGDDNGELDGVLLVHAGVGQENDPATGLIQALQFYLQDPVLQDGVAASFYAVASAASGPGVWAHETGHLLGMEDRYDLSLAPGGASEVVSRGGLGAFSLMSAGAWGSGSGRSPALPDAYTLLHLGWAEAEVLTPYRNDPVIISPVAAGGKVGRLSVSGSVQEYFLLEVRSPDLSAPFDAAVPGGNLIVYHVDESLAEGNLALGGPGGWHLRVGVVEADGDVSLHDGLDSGSGADLFPGTRGVHALPSAGQPSLIGYDGVGRFSLENIQTTAAGVTVEVVPSGESGVSYRFAVDAAAGLVDLAMGTAGRRLVAPVTCDVVLDDPTWGTFAAGADSLRIPLFDDGAGWYRPAAAITWLFGLDPPAGAATVFRLQGQEALGALPPSTETWVWKTSADALDFTGQWPGPWSINADGSSGTTWYRWPAPAAPAATGGAVLACTGGEFPDGSSWPDVHYDNSAFATLSSPPLAADVVAVRLVHAIESETLAAGTAIDGGRLVWSRGTGGTIPAVPVGGYDHQISPKAVNELQGQDVFACDSLSLREGKIVWNVDVVVKPDSGPWHLGFQFGSNNLWRRRGWFVAALETITAAADTLPFAALWQDDAGGDRRLTWTWPWPDAEPDQMVLQSYQEAGKVWVDRGTIPTTASVKVAWAPLRAMVDSDVALIRLLATGPYGWVATRALSLGAETSSPDSGSLGLPWPNPGTPPLRVEANLPVAATGAVVIYDLRGRRIDSLPVPGGGSVLGWDGCDSRGMGVPAGLYFLRLEGLPGSTTRKVILLR